MVDFSKIQDGLESIYEESKKNPDQSEDNLKRLFHKSEILEELGYDEDDIRVEKTIEDQNRTDIHCVDEYGNVQFVIEFKKPNVSNLRAQESEESQLQDRYMEPLKADYGFLYNGLKIIPYRRAGRSIESEEARNVSNLSIEDCKHIFGNLNKPDYELTDIEQVESYLNEYKASNKRMLLREEVAKNHFFENFRLEKNSVFGNLLQRTIELFNHMEGENSFLDGAYDFWKKSYARKPDEVPDQWKDLMRRANLEENDEDLYKFMFCLETAYAIFARLILAKAGEDYELPDVQFSKFIGKRVDDASRLGDIAGAAWAKISYQLTKDMKERFVSSVFEEDLFYWWTEPYEDKSYDDLFSKGQAPEEGRFGKSIGKMVLMIYKFDFSSVDGDPLGVLYQQYFDKKTRKALGEFYTPDRVVDYILNSLDYEGRQVLRKRVLDPACGSGTFPVTALQRYLEASKDLAEKKGWDYVLDDICNKYRIVGFDIHPFATIMSQIQFTLVIIPYYRKALKDAQEKGDHFTLQRVPIFRTNSLAKKRTDLDDYEGDKRVSMTVDLPVRKDSDDDFFSDSFEMPAIKHTIEEEIVDDNEEYFAALQALFDVVKDQAKGMNDLESIPDFNSGKFEKRLKERYTIENKEWKEISDHFTPFANDVLQKIYKLQTEFDDGRLVKNIEDVFLAAILKNEQKYDYVVGNPPYVRQEFVNSKEDLEEDFPDVYQGRADLYVYFMRRALDWIKEDGEYGYITSGKFTKTGYGKYLRAAMVSKGKISEILDFRGIDVFEDATNDPMIITQDKDTEEMDVKISYRDPSKDIPQLLDEVRDDKDEDYMVSFTYPNAKLEDQIRTTTTNRDYISTFNILPEDVREVLEKIGSEGISLESVFDVYRGIRTGRNSVYVVEKDKFKSNVLKPVLRGTDVDGFITQEYDSEIIYTDSNYVPDKESRLFAYLEKNKDDLESRSQYSNRKDNGEDIEWYQIEQPLSPELFEKDKIIAQRITQDYRFSIDKNGFYTLETCTTLIPQKENISLEAYVGLLNSSVMEFFAKADGKSLGEDGYELEKQFVERMPVKKEFNDIESIVNKIIEIKEARNRMNNIQRYIDSGVERNPREIKFKASHSSIDPDIQRLQDDMFGVIIGGRKKEDPIALDTREKANYVRKLLKDRSPDKKDKMIIKVPKSSSAIKEALNQYEKDKEMIEEEASVRELKEKIDQKAYELYNLEDREIEVLEEFLQKF